MKKSKKLELRKKALMEIEKKIKADDEETKTQEENEKKKSKRKKVHFEEETNLPKRRKSNKRS